MLMQLMQAWNMRMAVADSRNYREIVEMLVVGIVRIHVRSSMREVLDEGLQRPQDTQRCRHPDRRHRMNLDEPHAETSQTASHIEIPTLPLRLLSPL